jgi:hypothetical protein
MGRKDTVPPGRPSLLALIKIVATTSIVLFEIPKCVSLLQLHMHSRAVSIAFVGRVVWIDRQVLSPCWICKRDLAKVSLVVFFVISNEI